MIMLPAQTTERALFGSGLGLAIPLIAGGAAKGTEIDLGGIGTRSNVGTFGYLRIRNDEIGKSDLGPSAFVTFCEPANEIVVMLRPEFGKPEILPGS